MSPEYWKVEEAMIKLEMVLERNTLRRGKKILIRGVILDITGAEGDFALNHLQCEHILFYAQPRKSLVYRAFAIALI
jgi:hypothetical protein